MPAGEHEDDWARTSVEHLQAAAREVIQATRSLLDAAEELVDDPAAVRGLVGSVASVAQTLAGRLRDQRGEAPDDARGDGDDGRVQRIHVS